MNRNHIVGRIGTDECAIQHEVQCKRAAERLLESCRKYLEGKQKLKMNAEKGEVVRIFAKQKFKFLGFCLGKNENGIYICAHRKSLSKGKAEVSHKA